MKKINFYIGSNNTTHELEKQKAIDILSGYYEGMSISELVGLWQGIKEQTMLVSVVCDAVDYTLVKNACKKLNNELNQQAIMVEILDSNTIFISDR
jgi:hypothetical protein